MADDVKKSDVPLVLENPEAELASPGSVSAYAEQIQERVGKVVPLPLRRYVPEEVDKALQEEIEAERKLREGLEREHSVMRGIDGGERKMRSRLDWPAEARVSRRGSGGVIGLEEAEGEIYIHGNPHLYQREGGGGGGGGGSYGGA